MSRPTSWPPQNIFIGEDIRKQLPNESALFDQVNSSWKSIMDQMSRDSNALQSTHRPGLSAPCALVPQGLGGRGVRVRSWPWASFIKGPLCLALLPSPSPLLSVNSSVNETPQIHKYSGGVEGSRVG